MEAINNTKQYFVILFVVERVLRTDVSLPLLICVNKRQNKKTNIVAEWPFDKVLVTRRCSVDIHESKAIRRFKSHLVLRLFGVAK